MKKIIVGAIATIFAVIGAPIVLVSAQTDTPPVEETMEMTTLSQDATAEGRANGRADRINQYKEKIAEKLSQAQEQRVAARCKNAQIKIDRLQSNVETVIQNRQDVYSRVVTRLEALVASLQAASVDTTEIEASITELNGQIDQLTTDVEAYATTLADIAAMDCEADPEGFRAALATAREQRLALFAQAQAIRVYINESLKPILQTIKQSLAETSTETDTEQEEGTE